MSSAPSRGPRSHPSAKQHIAGQPTDEGPDSFILRRSRRKNQGAVRQLSQWLVDNQLRLSLTLMGLLFIVHSGFSQARHCTARFFSLAYYSEKSGQYGVGRDDVYLVAFFVTLFTGLRAGTMEYIMSPFARWRGLSKKKELVRFNEQAWLLVYYNVFWPMGMYIYAQSPYWLNLRELWTDWPNRETSGLMKAYMLAQLAFWLQQLIVINIEARRKDHWQMFSHHVLTIVLVYCSYRYHHTRVGNVVLILMDVVDLFFPLAKCLKYLGHTTLCDIMFGIFMASWVAARHVFHMMVCWSVYAHTPEIMANGCFSGSGDNMTGPVPPPDNYTYLLQPLISNTGLVCYNPTVKWAFLAGLLLLQGLMVMWFSMIVRVAIKVLSGSGADDVRSEDEEEDEETEETEETAAYLEEEVGAESLDFRNWERRAGIKRGNSHSASSGISIPGHSDRKELLNRIGCDKQID